MKAVLIGSVSSTRAALEGMLEGGLTEVGVLGMHHRHASRVSDYVDLRPLAESSGLAYMAFDKIKEPQVRVFLQQADPDWIFVIGLSQLIPEDLRNLARKGAVGFHPTMLPEGRGRAPVAWTIIKQARAAANLFFLTDEADAGDIIAQREVPVLPDDYARDLIDRTNVVLKELMIELVPKFISGDVPRMPQDQTQATYYPKRTPADGIIDWGLAAEEIARLVRAVSHPYPGAFSYIKGKKVMVWQAHPHALLESSETHGTVVALDEGYPVVQTGKGQIRLTDIRDESGSPVEVQPGAQFEEHTLGDDHDS